MHVLAIIACNICAIHYSMHANQVVVRVRAFMQCLAKYIHLSSFVNNEQTHFELFKIKISCLNIENTHLDLNFHNTNGLNSEDAI